VFTARVFDSEVQRPLLFRWYFTSDHCGRDHGFHGASSELPDVSAIRVALEKGELQNIIEQLMMAKTDKN
jgi:hypothetical protein